jgi:hypothetical protein
MRGATPPLPHYVFMAYSSVKHRENITFITFDHKGKRPMEDFGIHGKITL